MTHFCPAYPQPRKSRVSRFLMFFSARRSWLDGLYERSYRMRMGEVHLPGLDLYMINEPALVKRVLGEQADQFPKSALMGEALQPLLGESIFTTNGELWKRQRAMMEPAFAQARINVAFPVMREAVQAMLARLDQLADASGHDVEIEMTHVTADIIFRTIFSVPLEGETAQKIFSSFATFQRLAPRLLLPSLFGLRWLVMPWDIYRSRKSAAFIRQLLEQLIKPRFNAHRTGTAKVCKTSWNFSGREDPVNGKRFSLDEVVDQVAMLFLAGHETSASALTWACYLLAKSPDIQERMHAEAATLPADDEVNASDVKGLELTWNVFARPCAFSRLWVSSPDSQPRVAPCATKTVKAGASVVISPWLIHRHTDMWDQPDAFNPDRYANEQSRESLRNAYLPFGMGPRVCMGAAFALQEAALILSGICRHYRLEPVPGHIPEPVGRLTIRSANGVRLMLHRRSTSARSSTGRAIS